MEFMEPVAIYFPIVYNCLLAYTLPTPASLHIIRNISLILDNANSLLGGHYWTPKKQTCNKSFFETSSVLSIEILDSCSLT
jgi:hypothetical protein